MTAVAHTLGVARSNLSKRLRGSAKPRRRYHKAQDGAVLPLLKRLVAARPTYGYRRIAALMSRELAASGAPPINHKRVYRLMQAHGLLLAKHSGARPGRVHDGKVVVMRSDLRWCSDGLEFACWSGETVRMAFLIDAHDREIIAQAARWREPGSAAPMSATCCSRPLRPASARRMRPTPSSSWRTTAHLTRPRRRGSSQPSSV